MCGIHLSIYPGRSLEMAQKASHRGESIKIKEYGWGNASHNRLAIQGLDEKYDCPFEIGRNNDILFNGEIYNYKDINRKYKSDVECFKNNPDIGLFEGDYAFVEIYSKGKQGRMSVMTDKYGKRQLYYRLEGNNVTEISSEIKSLIREGDEIDYYYLGSVCKFGYFFMGENTMIKGIKKFLPGHNYQFYLGNHIYTKDKIFEGFEKVEDISYENLRLTIEESVQNRLVSDVPIAMLYSGGIDSSILLYNLHKLGKKDIQLFSVDNGEDLDYAKKYSNDLGRNISIVPYKEENYMEIQKWNELGADLGSFSLNYSLFKAVKEAGYKVCLTADGADEVFSGYKRNKDLDHQQTDVFNELVQYHLPRLDRTAMVHTVEYRSPFTANKVIEFGLSVPYEQRIDKKILREAYRGLIPNYIIDRNKNPLKVETIKTDPLKQRIELCKWMEKNFIKSWL